jgi:CheY-like chemotaxis protein
VAGARSIGQGSKVSRIVVIEDHVDTAELLCELLYQLGHEAQAVHTGSDGIAIVRRIHPDVVLCDVGLPDMDGYAVARALRADASTAGARLIVMTGYDGEEDRRLAYEAGFEVHVAKPVDAFAIERLLGVAPPHDHVA